MSVLVDILLENKRDPEQEISIYFFENCNMSCAFCWQDHASRHGLDTVREKLSAVEAYFQEESRSLVTLSMMGGELFSDNIFNDQLLEDYKFVTAGIQALSVKYNKKTTVIWVTNLVTSQLDKIRELLQYGRSTGLTVRLSTSYDFRGRFNLNQFLTFKKNVDLIWDEIGTFSLTMTKTNCEYFLNKTDPYFDYLYNKGAYFYFDYYMPDESAEYQCPSDSLLYSVFQKGIREYPRIDPWASWINNNKNTASCRSSKMINSDNSRSNCGALVIAQNEQATTKIYEIKLHNRSNSNIEHHFLDKYNCITCEFVERCSFGCFMQHASTRYTEELDDCVYRKTFQFIDNEKALHQVT